MDLQPSEGELISLQVTSQTLAREALDRSMETEELEQWERGSRMDPPIDQCIQTESIQHTAQIDPIPDLSDFLKRTMPRIMRALEPRQSRIPCNFPTQTLALAGTTRTKSQRLCDFTRLRIERKL